MANVRVLFADSDSAFRTNAQRALTRQGYFVIPVAKAADALSRLESDPVDIVVSDVSLRQGSGIEILRALKAKNATTPIILLSDVRSIADAAGGVREGAFDYLLKPLDDFTRLALLIDRATGHLAPTSGAESTATAEATPAASDALLRFLRVTSTETELTPLLDAYTAELAQLAHASHAAVLLTHQDGQFHLAASHGFIDRAEAAIAYVQGVGDDFAWRIANAKQLLWHEVPPNIFGQNGSQAAFGLPLLYANQVLGVAVAYSTIARDQLPATTLDIIQYLTAQAALAVELTRLRATAARLDPFDAATGLFTREHFLDLATREFRRSWRYSQPLSLLQIDIDEFSRLHLLLGPKETDNLLKQIASIVRPRVRAVDVVGRADTDSLSALLVMATREHAQLVGERLRRAIAELEVTTSEGAWQVTASIGAVTYPREQCASIHDLVALAEQATRAAKRAGRNRVVSV